MIRWCLKDLAEPRGMTVRQLTNATGLTYPTVLHIWRGSATRVDLATLDALCSALQVQPGDLFVYDPPRPAPPGQEGTWWKENPGDRA